MLVFIAIPWSSSTIANILENEQYLAAIKNLIQPLDKRVRW